MAGRGAKPKGKEHFLEFAEIYVSNGNNVAAAMRATGFNESNSTRFMQQRGVRDAIAYVRANIGEYKNCSLEKVIDIIAEANRELDNIEPTNTLENCKRVEVKLKCAKLLIELMGYNAPVRTEHARINATAGAKELDEIIKRAENNEQKEDEIIEVEADVVEGDEEVN